MDAEFVLKAFDWLSLRDAAVVDVCYCPRPEKVYHSLFVDKAYWMIYWDR